MAWALGAWEAYLAHLAPGEENGRYEAVSEFILVIPLVIKHDFNASLYMTY